MADGGGGDGSNSSSSSSEAGGGGSDSDAWFDFLANENVLNHHGSDGSASSDNDGGMEAAVAARTLSSMSDLLAYYSAFVEAVTLEDRPYDWLQTIKVGVSMGARGVHWDHVLGVFRLPVG